ncbi:MAG: hypothetical protein US46_C0009G0019 [Candidatus Shapirobacteria bacterium GW2011_GWF2_37_20]|nr:MAG: hypothetical protein US46_C0009G0019 [Candidatus Shapirobacteria bacterium GW2011_GWF2_37_20]
MLLSNNQIKKTELSTDTMDITPTEEVVSEEVLSFGWLQEEGKAILVITANEEVAIDAIDLYMAYNNTKISAVKNLGELPKPSFSKISTENSLVVMNYLIGEEGGFVMTPGQMVQVAQLDLSVNSGDVGELSIDSKTQVVENGSAEVLPFNSQKLIINGTL